MKKTKVVIPALGLIAFGVAASVTGTVAWFTANTRVQVSGMTVKTKVSNNLFIADDSTSGNAKKADNLFTAGPLVQTVKGILEPVSTVNGHDFFYTNSAKADGDATADDYKAYNIATPASDTDTYANKFSEDYGITQTDAGALIEGLTGAIGYVDFAFQLRATNSDTAARDLKITALNLTYTAAGEESDGNKAYRLALSVEDITIAAPSGDFIATATGIFAPSGAGNHSDSAGKNFAVSATDTVSQLTVAGNKYNNDNLGTLASINAGLTKYYKVIARLYLEGEDTTCTASTFAALNGSWALGLTCELGGANSAVTALTIN